MTRIQTLTQAESDKRRSCGFPAALLVCALAGLLFPEASWAAGGGEDRWGAWLTIGRLFNLGLVVLVLAWVARKPLAEFFGSRSRAIREQLEEARRAREEAEARLAQVEARMARLDEELAHMRVTAEKEAQEEYERLSAAAGKDAAKIVERARQEIDGAVRAAQVELKEHAAELTVRLAEDQIRREIDEVDRSRLVTRFVDEIGRNP